MYVRTREGLGQGTIPTATTPAPPPDRLDKPDMTITGKRCPSGRGKCWPWPGKSKDVVDKDVPWNDASQRSPENYSAVLDYFNVGNSGGRSVEDHKRMENDRYRRITKGQTWCNIYLHDVTRAMWANIPHWVKKASGDWTELNANATVGWLNSAEGRKHGWIKIDRNLKDWIGRMTGATTLLPSPDPAVTQNLRMAAWRIAKAPDTDPQLLTQASYVAQRLANQGLPTVVVWENLSMNCRGKTGKPKRCSGHVAMIRPENSLKGRTTTKGRFVPRSAQAGAENWTNKLAVNMTMRTALYFVHE